MESTLGGAESVLGSVVAKGVESILGSVDKGVESTFGGVESMSVCVSVLIN